MSDSDSEEKVIVLQPPKGSKRVKKEPAPKPAKKPPSAIPPPLVPKKPGKPAVKRPAQNPGKEQVIFADQTDEIQDLRSQIEGIRAKQKKLKKKICGSQSEAQKPTVSPAETVQKELPVIQEQPDEKQRSQSAPRKPTILELMKRKPPARY